MPPASADHLALLARLDAELVGVASYEPVGRADVAEIAFAVADHAHGRGVAMLLLEHLVSAACSRGVRTFTAQTLAEKYALRWRPCADPSFPRRRSGRRLAAVGPASPASEVPGDRTVRLSPLTDADADELIRSGSTAPHLLGLHGAPAVDLTALAAMLMRVSRLADDFPELAELEINPLIASPDGVFAVSARARVTPGAAADPFLR